MPAVKPNESEDKYISRCVAYVVKNEGASQKQALGKCYGMWKEAKKRKRAKANITNINQEPEWVDPEINNIKIKLL